MICQQKIARLDAESLDIECGAILISLECADRMDAPKEAPQPFQRVAALQFRRPSAVFFKNRKTEAVEVMQCLVVDH